MSAKIRLSIGQRFGRLTAVSEDGPIHQKSRWLFQCDCGKTKVAYVSKVVKGETRSCGCLHNEQLAARSRTHGMSKSGDSVFTTWEGMKQRCSDPNTSNYANYGGRGIKVCDRWINNFLAFQHDMGPKPTPEHTLERKDNNGNYEPENCCWATRIEQRANTCEYGRARERNILSQL